MAFNGETPLAEIARRLIDKIERDPLTECWNWTGASGPGGYGQLRVNYELRPAHQVSFEFFVGPIPSGREIDHLCRNPRCVNPKHLDPVTHVENVRRGNAGINHRDKTHCPYGHAYDHENTIYNARGGRACRECNRRRSREWQMNRRLSRRAAKHSLSNGGYHSV